MGGFIQEVSFEKENLLVEVCTAPKTLGGKKMQASQWGKKPNNTAPQHFKIITLILQRINIHTAKMSCKRWVNDKMIY